MEERKKEDSGRQATGTGELNDEGLRGGGGELGKKEAEEERQQQEENEREELELRGAAQ